MSNFENQKFEASEINNSNKNEIFSRAKWTLGTGEIVKDSPNSHVVTHITVLPYLSEALSKVSANGRNHVEDEIDFEKIIGETICVETHKDDEIIYAQRVNRLGLTRFVKNKEAEPCSTVLVAFHKKEEEKIYTLITAYIGHRAPLEPWDKDASEKSVAFWNTHALVWGKEAVLEGTETKKCPW